MQLIIQALCLIIQIGIKAMAAQLHLYQNRDHLNTINDIVSKYAPKSENDTAAYIADMVGKTGFKSDQSLDLNDTSTMSKLISAMTKHENSKSNFSQDMVSRIIVTTSAGSDLVVSANTIKQ